MLASGRIDIYSIFYLAVQEHSLSACHINSDLKWAGIVQFQGLCPGPNSALINERILEKFWQVEFLFSWQWGTWTRSLLGETTVAQFSLPPAPWVWSRWTPFLPSKNTWLGVSLPLGSKRKLSAHLVPLLLSLETSLSASIIFKPIKLPSLQTVQCPLGWATWMSGSQCLTPCACNDLNLSHTHHCPETAWPPNPQIPTTFHFSAHQLTWPHPNTMTLLRPSSHWPLHCLTIQWSPMFTLLTPVRWQVGCALGELHLKYNLSQRKSALNQLSLKEVMMSPILPPSVPVVTRCHQHKCPGLRGCCPVPVHFCPCLLFCVSTKSQTWWSQIARVLFAVVMMQFS